MSLDIEPRLYSRQSFIPHQPLTVFPIYAFVKINAMIQEKKV